MRSFGLQQDFVLALGCVFLLWLGIALYIVLTRAIYDARDALVRAAQRVLERGLDEALSREDPAALERVPRYAVERVAADSATAAPVAHRFALRALELNGERLHRAAAGHRNERTKWRRIAALRILGAAEETAALPLLAAGLEDADEDVAAAAATVLGGFPSPEAGRLLVRALVERRIPAPLAAAQIDRTTAELHEVLRPLCDHHDALLRRWAAVLLARYDAHEQVVLDLVALAGDPEPDVRAAAVQALGRFRSVPALGAAVALLEDDVWYVRARAARSLAAQARPELAGLLTRLLADEQWWVRTAAKETLESFGPGADDALVQALEHEDEFARNAAAEVLQNTGALERLVAPAIADPADMSAVRVLRLAFAAGGERIAAAAVERAAQAEDVGAVELLRRLERAAAEG